MCDICTTAKRFPSIRHALNFLGNQITSSHQPPPVCVDQLIGELAGVPDLKVDRKAEADWERAIHGEQ